MTNSELCAYLCQLEIERSDAEYNRCLELQRKYRKERNHTPKQYLDTSDEEPDTSDEEWYEQMQLQEQERIQREQEEWYEEQERIRQEEEAEREYQQRLDEIKDKYPTYRIDLVADGADLDMVESDARLDDWLMNRCY